MISNDPVLQMGDPQTLKEIQKLDRSIQDEPSEEETVSAKGIVTQPNDDCENQFST